LAYWRIDVLAYWRIDVLAYWRNAGVGELIVAGRKQWISGYDGGGVRDFSF
jgi:hypothetical protein